jgi:hypothetical protein
MQQQHRNRHSLGLCSLLLLASRQQEQGQVALLALALARAVAQATGQAVQQQPALLGAQQPQQLAVSLQVEEQHHQQQR